MCAVDGAECVDSSGCTNNDRCVGHICTGDVDVNCGNCDQACSDGSTCCSERCQACTCNNGECFFNVDSSVGNRSVVTCEPTTTCQATVTSGDLTARCQEATCVWSIIDAESGRDVRCSDRASCAITTTASGPNTNDYVCESGATCTFLMTDVNQRVSCLDEARCTVRYVRGDGVVRCEGAAACEVDVDTAGVAVTCIDSPCLLRSNTGATLTCIGGAAVTCSDGRSSCDIQDCP